MGKGARHQRRGLPDLQQLVPHAAGGWAGRSVRSLSYLPEPLTLGGLAGVSQRTRMFLVPVVLTEPQGELGCGNISALTPSELYDATAGSGFPPASRQR